MTLSKRERYIAIATVAVVGLLLLDWMVLTPWFEARDRVSTQLSAARQALDHSEQTFSNLRRANRRWAELSGGALANDAPTAEGQVLNALRDWAQAAGLSLTALRPERGQASHGFQQITIRVTAGGRMEHLAQFLWRVEQTTLPLRLNDVQIASRRPGADELTMQMAVSTIFLSPPDTQERTR